jgi:transposase InsO family protein
MVPLGDRGRKTRFHYGSWMSRETHVQFWERVGVKLPCATRPAMESFWSSLKTETGLDRIVPETRKDAELAVFDYIETFYNPTRRHSSLGQISPVAFENQQQQNDNIAA